MKYTFFEILIVVLVTGILLLGFLYFNDILTIKKDYGSKMLNELYSGHAGRVRILNNPITLRKFNLKNEKPSILSVDEAEIEIVAIATYNTTVKVMAKRNYEGGKSFPWDVVSPYDLFFRWGELAKPEHDNILNKIDYGYVERKANLKLLMNETKFYNSYRSYQSNTHAVILDEDIKDLIKKIEIGDIVHFDGYLVKVISRTQGFQDTTWGGETDITNAGIDLFSSCETFFITNAILYTD